MKIYLFYPPVGNIAQPYLSIPSIVAYLRQNHIKDVTVFDLNLDTTGQMLHPQRLRRAFRWCYHRLNRASAYYQNEPEELARSQFQQNALAVGSSAIEKITLAKSTFRSSQFYRPELYLKSLNTVLESYLLLSARYFPSVLSYQTFSTRYRCDTSSDILKAVNDHQENPFLEIFKQSVSGIVAQNGAADLVGISIGYYEQLIPGLTLAKVTKDELPNAHITIGGTMISALNGKSIHPEFFKLFDSIVLFEGEIPLLKLIEALSDGANLNSVPNLIFRHNGKIIKTEISSQVEDINRLPTPEFEADSLHEYFSPAPILPLAASRGCYWRRCAFCTRQHFQQRFRQRNPQRIIEDIQTLQHKLNAHAFYFVDECILPAVLDSLVTEIIAQKLDIRWSCYVRFEKAFLNKQFCQKLYAGGLRMLYFGLESACQRIIDLMQKGTHKAEIGEILRNTAAVGIMNMVLYFVGFPTETRDEALETMDFILQHRTFITYALAGRFLLEEHSPVFNNPAEFGVTEIFPLAGNSDLGLIYNYKTKSGMADAEIAEVQEYVNKKTQSLHNFNLLNRSHLLLLGNKFTNAYQRMS